jgi:hypothetical protein
MAWRLSGASTVFSIVSRQARGRREVRGGEAQASAALAHRVADRPLKVVLARLADGVRILRQDRLARRLRHRPRRPVRRA